MASALQGPPPLPANVGSAVGPSLRGMAGAPAGNPSPGDQSTQIIAQHLMTAESEIRAAIRIKPELSSVLEDWLSRVKPQIGQILFGGGSQPAAPPGPTSLLTSGAQSLNTRP